MKALLITREDIVKRTPLSGNIDLDKIKHFIKIAQDVHLQGILGTRLYDKLGADIIAGTLTGSYLTLVNEYIKPTLVQYSFLEFLPFAQYTIGNKGVFKKSSENGETVESADTDRMKEATRDTAQHYATRLVNHLRANAHNSYPEYLTTNLIDEMKPQKDISFGGWNI